MVLSRFGISCGLRVPSGPSSYPYALPGEGIEGGSAFLWNVIRLVLYIYGDREMYIELSGFWPVHEQFHILMYSDGMDQTMYILVKAEVDLTFLYFF